MPNIEIKKKRNPDRLPDERTPSEYAAHIGVSRQMVMKRIALGIVTSRKIVKKKRTLHFINIKKNPA